VICKKCGVERQPDRFRKPGHQCKDCYNAVRLTYRHERANEEQRDRWKAAARDRANAKHAVRRAAVLAAYGGCCQCCGEAEPVFLAIDHINNDGAAHRRELGIDRQMGGGATFYRWLVTNGFPPGFQVLCHNCNWAKSHGGCPHASSS
jgi:hypothetical protein